MNFWKTLDGMVTVKLTSADPEGAMGVMMGQGIRLYRVEQVDDLTVRFQCVRDDRGKLIHICRKRGDSLSFHGETGIIPWGKRLRRRPVLLAGMALLFALTVFLPRRVLFFQVEGNKTVPSRLILEAAGGCGIRFGVSRQQVRSEKMKNALLEAMPELKWAGINTSGCTAVISVREREPEEKHSPVSTGFGSIAAVRDAYVTSLTVTRGSALCGPGEVVAKGQILISGQTDLGLCIQITQAQGEVFGETVHEFRAVTPAWRLNRGRRIGTKRRYSLIFGKNRINFGKGSGISPATCGRMYEEYHLSLPGGFQLPVRLGVETFSFWETGQEQWLPEESAMAAYARDQVIGRTVAGSILSENLIYVQEDYGTILQGRFSVLEMIGRVTKNEIGETNGKTD